LNLIEKRALKKKRLLCCLENLKTPPSRDTRSCLEVRFIVALDPFIVSLKNNFEVATTMTMCIILVGFQQNLVVAKAMTQHHVHDDGDEFVCFDMPISPNRFFREI
jgi:hypothetical protein